MSTLRTGLRHRAGSVAAALLAASAAASCASSAVRTEQSSRAEDRVITGEEVAALSVSTAHDVVERLRPLWLRSAGPRSRSPRLVTEVVVVTNGQYFGNLSSLRQIPAAAVREIRYMTGSEATNAYPWLASGRHVESAIIIVTGGDLRESLEEAR